MPRGVNTRVPTKDPQGYARGGFDARSTAWMLKGKKKTQRALYRTNKSGGSSDCCIRVTSRARGVIRAASGRLGVTYSDAIVALMEVQKE